MGDKKDFALFGRDLFGEAVKPDKRGIISDRFLLPPFSVFNQRDGAWQERKQAWMSLGIKSEEGRDDELTFHMKKWLDEHGKNSKYNQTSVFDPVLCELLYTWFCPRGGQILDPFAGGSVRGMVAGMLERRYWGCDLSREQVTANFEQLFEIAPELAGEVEWAAGDAGDLVPDAPDADFIFSCPPYGDLEKYSKNEKDLSAMKLDKFNREYSKIVKFCCDRLKKDRFACFVVGDYRDRGNHGELRDFVSTTIKAFNLWGLLLYNEAILVGSCGTMALRISKQFDLSRKMGKVHQNVLVFVKGDPRRATQAILDSDKEENVE